MEKKYIKIEYTGDMPYKKIVEEVFKQLYILNSAVDLFEKMKDIEITQDTIIYGDFEIVFIAKYDGMEKVLETDITKGRKGKMEVAGHIEGAIFSNGTKVEDPRIINALKTNERSDFEISDQYDIAAKKIIKKTYNNDELMKIAKYNAGIRSSHVFNLFTGDLQIEPNYKISDGTIIEINVIKICFKYNDDIFNNVCILNGNDCIMIVDYPNEINQAKKIIDNVQEPELISLKTDYKEAEEKFDEIKPYKNSIDTDVWDRTEKSMVKLKHEYDKVIKQYLSNYKKESYEKIIKNINNMFTEDVDNSNKLITIDELSELNYLIGLTKVKQDVKQMVDLIKVNNKRKEMNLPITSMSYHLVFSGNPGTGKTTVARILAKIYKELGVIKNEKVVEVDRSELVAGYVGQTAIKTQEVIDSAKGGILFIDEAYTLARGNNADDFGQEAIDTILKEMEDNRDNLVVIVAGYTDLMKKFILSNPGLESRFNKYIEFDDYTPDELYQILELNCKNKGYVLSEDAKIFAKEFFINRYNNRDENYANARDVRNFFEKAIVHQSSRIVKEGIDNMSKEDMSKITKEDLENIELK